MMPTFNKNTYPVLIQQTKDAIHRAQKKGDQDLAAKYQKQLEGFEKLKKEYDAR